MGIRHAGTQKVISIGLRRYTGAFLDNSEIIMSLWNLFTVSSDTLRRLLYLQSILVSNGPGTERQSNARDVTFSAYQNHYASDASHDSFNLKPLRIPRVFTPTQCHEQHTPLKSNVQNATSPAAASLAKTPTTNLAGKTTPGNGSTPLLPPLPRQQTVRGRSQEQMEEREKRENLAQKWGISNAT